MLITIAQVATLLFSLPVRANSIDEEHTHSQGSHHRATAIVTDDWSHLLGTPRISPTTNEHGLHHIL